MIFMKNGNLHVKQPIYEKRSIVLACVFFKYFWVKSYLFVVLRATIFSNKTNQKKSFVIKISNLQ
jgi:hypothetical protein